jgi:hypothetical protein
MDAVTEKPATRASAVIEEAPAAPKFAVDPMMAEGGARGGGASFSEMTELPPLKEIYVEPPPSTAFEAPAPTATAFQPGHEEEKPKIQPRVVAQKALSEIKGVPPRLVMYSVGGAVAVILILAVALAIHIHNLNTADEPPAAAVVSAAPTQPGPAQSQPAPVAPQPAEPSEDASNEASATAGDTQPVHALKPAASGRSARKKAVPAPAIVPGQMAIDSTPQGAQVQIDGRADASWITPFTVTGVEPGHHTITVSKAGYNTDARAVDVVSGSKSFVISHLAQLMATLAVTSTPAGANVYIDGRDTGKTTPAQVGVDKGQHVILVRKSGFIDETMNSQFALGQTVNFSPGLRALGNVDEIKTVSRVRKLFGGGGAQGMGTVSVRTQPKGAQVAVNQHMVEKASPVDFVLDPGNYVVDITMSGYASVHKVIAVDKGGKVVIDETLQRE